MPEDVDPYRLAQIAASLIHGDAADALASSTAVGGALELLRRSMQAVGQETDHIEKIRSDWGKEIGKIEKREAKFEDFRREQELAKQKESEIAHDVASMLDTKSIAKRTGFAGIPVAGKTKKSAIKNIKGIIASLNSEEFGNAIDSNRWVEALQCLLLDQPISQINADVLVRNSHVWKTIHDSRLAKTKAQNFKTSTAKTI